MIIFLGILSSMKQKEAMIIVNDFVCDLQWPLEDERDLNQRVIFIEKEELEAIRFLYEKLGGKVK